MSISCSVVEGRGPGRGRFRACGRGAEAGHGHRPDPERGRPSRSKVAHATSRASVESRPPDRPSVTRVAACARAAWPGRRSGWRRSLGSARRDGGIAGHEGCGSTRRTRRCGLGGGDLPQVARGGTAAPGHDRVGEGGLPRALDQQALHVHVGDQELALAAEALALGQQGRVLGDQELAAEDDVGGGLVHAAGGFTAAGITGTLSCNQ